MTLAQLEAFRDGLREALYSGALTVKHSDLEVTYRSTRQIQAALYDCERQIEKLGGGGPPRAITISTSKGL
ncbi:MAG: hypothetical protein AAF479_05635 [Pseudomonadota bacterium]